MRFAKTKITVAFAVLSVLCGAGAAQQQDLDSKIDSKEGELEIIRGQEREHLAGSLWIGLDGKFATWAGTLLPLDRPVVLVAAPGEEEQASVRLGRIGHDAVAGYLDGGLDDSTHRPKLLASSRRVDVSGLRAALASDDPPQVIDIRTPGEWESGHIEGARWIPLIELESRIAEVPADTDVTLVCASGYRSMIASSLLAARGFERIADLAGGMNAWNETACTA